MKKYVLLALLGSAILAAPASAAASAAVAPLRPDQTDFRSLYQELVETDTTLSAGSCTLAAQRMAARLRSAGIPDSQITMFAVPEHPKDGGLVAVFPGTSKTLKPMLLLAHIDVVEAKRADWTRDPFTLVEENGQFYARGTSDDKAQAAVWTDTLIRFAKEGYKPKRTVKLALTCGEESSGAFNGAEWLTKNKRELIDAAFALNEGGGGRSDATGKLIVQTIQVGEKAYQDFTLTATNEGGHSSAPIRDNAIYAMADAVTKIRDYEFGLQFNDTTRTFFAKAGPLYPGAAGKAMAALAANPGDAAAQALVNQDRSLHSMLRTTCVATMVEGGHAHNALPQRVSVNVNCRMFPGRTSDETQAELARVIGNPGITIEQTVKGKPIASAPPLDPAIIGPMTTLAGKHFPGVPVVPVMSTGATDGVFLGAAGIPTYGVPGIWTDSKMNNIHGLNEHMEVRALYEGRDYMYALAKLLSSR